MGEYSIVGRVIENLGATGLMVLVIWKLADRWLAKFLAASMAQAEAMGALAAAVKDGQGDTRETLLAVRVLASKIDTVMRAMDRFADRRPDAD